MTTGRPRFAALDADRAYYSSRHWREVARPAALSAGRFASTVNCAASSRPQRKWITSSGRVAIVISNGIRTTCNASAPIAINTNRIGNGATTAALCASESPLAATPLSCGTGAVIGDGGGCKATKKGRYAFETRGRGRGRKMFLGRSLPHRRGPTRQSR